jgi:outer membrane protein insertion porin family
MRRLRAALLAASLGAPAALRAQATGAQVDSVEVTGNRRVTSETIRNVAALAPHTPLGYRDLQRAVRALFELGQFDDVQVLRRTGARNEEILVLQVQERPMLLRATVRGAEKVSERSVRDRIETPQARPLDPALVRRAVVRIDSLYEAAGYYLARVRPVITPAESGAVRLVFDIEEGRRVAIAAVQVEGNRAFTDAQVVGAMGTRPEGFFWFQGGEYNETKLREDLDKKLPDFYAARGYIDFRVLRDTLLVDAGNGKATLLVTVDEGRPYRVGTVTVDGNRFFTTEQVMTLNPFAARAGSGLSCLVRSCAAAGTTMFDQGAWDEATTKLRTQYSNEGYIYAEVRPVLERAAGPGDTGTVNVSWQIDEQHPAIVNRVEIVGNDVTHERVIREAIVILPGDVFAQDRILRSYQNISNLGFFQQPLPFPDTRRANEQGDLDLVFHVAEKHTGNVNFGASVGQGTGIGGFLGLEEPNLFGQGKRGKLQWQFGKNINDFNLSYADPALRGSRISGQVEVHNSRLRYTVSNLGQITTRGGDVQFGFPLPRSRYSRLFLSSGVEWDHYDSTGASQVLTQSALTCSECLRTYVGASFMRDTRIDLPFATGGSYHTAGVTLNGPLGSGTASFTRFDLEGRWYTPVARLGGGPTVGGIHFTIGLTTKAGFVVGDAGPFFRQLFAMGGTQYGIPLRGYDEFSITPSGYNPNASTSGVPQNAFGKSYFSTTAEFGARLTAQVYTSIFYDAGNVWATAAGFNPTRLFRGAGIGVALITPLGPLGLDFAYGFDRLNALGQPAPAWKLHFKVGNFF